MTFPLFLIAFIIAYLIHARRVSRRQDIQHKAAWQRLRERVSALESINSNRKREEMKAEKAERNGKSTQEQITVKGEQ